jgi:cystathionine beta-lyase family protein involved in aluminum resistance
MFKKLVEMNVNENIKVLHIDRGGGYLSKHSTNKKKIQNK